MAITIKGERVSGGLGSTDAFVQYCITLTHPRYGGSIDAKTKTDITGLQPKELLNVWADVTVFGLIAGMADPSAMNNFQSVLEDTRRELDL